MPRFIDVGTQALAESNSLLHNSSVLLLIAGIGLLVFVLLLVFISLYQRRKASSLIDAAVAEANAYSNKLMALHEISNELTTIDDPDMLLKRGVELGREKLGFDRLGIWLHDKETDMTVGTFGTDESGNTTDERDQIHDNYYKWLKHLEGGRPFRAYTDNQIRRSDTEIIGRGMHSVAALWDGRDVLGFIATDNYIHHEPITQSMNVLLVQFAITLGHLLRRKWTEKELRQNQERLAMAMEGTGDTMWEWDLSTGKVHFDPEWLALLGYAEEEIRYNHDWIAKHVPEETIQEARESLEAHLEGRSKYWEVEYRFRTKSDRDRWFWSRGKCVQRDENGNALRIMGTHREITDRKKLEEEQNKLEKQMQHTQKLESLGVLAGGIAHDFNNLLMGILGNADLALYEVSPVAPVRENLIEIETAAKRAAELCRQMLAYSGKGSFVISTINLNEVIEEMTHLLEISISKNVVLRYRLAKDLPSIEADVTQLRQVVMNLITNGSDAIEEKSGVITIGTGIMEIDQKALQDIFMNEEMEPGKFVFLEVSDTGCGMDKETQNRIFEPFFTTKFTGRGLGMAAVQGIVRSHGGCIKVYSEPGQGSTFKTFFPQSSGPAQKLNKTVRADSDWRGEGLMLLVDDEKKVITVGQRMLNRMGFEAYTAENGREAVEIYEKYQDRIRCVILDLTMPHMNGEETFRALRAINPAVCVMLSSGYTEQDVTSRFAGKNLAGFIQKPYQFSDLQEKIQKALESCESP